VVSSRSPNAGHLARVLLHRIHVECLNATQQEEWVVAGATKVVVAAIVGAHYGGLSDIFTTAISALGSVIIKNATAKEHFAGVENSAGPSKFRELCSIVVGAAVEFRTRRGAGNKHTLNAYGLIFNLCAAETVAERMAESIGKRGDDFWTTGTAPDACAVTRTAAAIAVRIAPRIQGDHVESFLKGMAQIYVLHVRQGGLVNEPEFSSSGDCQVTQDLKVIQGAGNAILAAATHHGQDRAQNAVADTGLAEAAGTVAALHNLPAPIRHAADRIQRVATSPGTCTITGSPSCLQCVIISTFHVALHYDEDQAPRLYPCPQIHVGEHHLRFSVHPHQGEMQTSQLAIENIESLCAYKDEALFEIRMRGKPQVCGEQTSWITVVAASKHAMQALSSALGYQIEVESGMDSEMVMEPLQGGSRTGKKRPHDPDSGDPSADRPRPPPTEGTNGITVPFSAPSAPQVRPFPRLQR
jgi:hypothetical protein